MTTPPKLPLGLTYGTIIPWIATGVFTAMSLWLASIFVTKTDLAASVRPFESLPPRVQAIEAWQTEQKISQKSNDYNIGAIQSDLAAIKALTAQKAANDTEAFNRILRKLDEKH